MSIHENPENTVYGSYGEFDPSDTSTWTDEDWAEYDAHVGQEIDEWEAQCAAEFDDFIPNEDVFPPF